MTVDLDDREADLMMRALHYVKERCDDELSTRIGGAHISRFTIRWTYDEITRLIAKLEPQA